MKQWQGMTSIPSGPDGTALWIKDSTFLNSWKNVNAVEGGALACNPWAISFVPFGNKREQPFKSE